MISCTEFIPVYSELFKYIQQRDSKEAVVRFWESLADNLLGNLHDYVEEHGIAGCFKYWSHTLTEEAADFRLTLDEVAQKFTLDMRHCPSMGMLIDLKHYEPYENYCEHCDVLYQRVLKPLGYDCELDMSQCHNATCKFIITKSE